MNLRSFARFAFAMLQHLQGLQIKSIDVSNPMACSLLIVSFQLGKDIVFTVIGQKTRVALALSQRANYKAEHASSGSAAFYMCTHTLLSTQAGYSFKADAFFFFPIFLFVFWWNYTAYGHHFNFKIHPFLRGYLYALNCRQAKLFYYIS